jgi:predicted glycosyltransferase
MNILVNVAHPAHVHFFKNAITNLIKKGHKVKITSKDKEVTNRLLEAYRFEYEVLDIARKGLVNKGWGMLKVNWKLLKVIRDFKPDCLLGINDESIAQVSYLTRKPSIVFTDTEHAKLGNLLTFPFAKIICTPSCYKLDLGNKQVRYNGYHELSYLHPNYFKPDPSILSDLGLSINDKFFILRFVSWSAAHDIKQKGLTDQKRLVRELENHGKVLITSERNLEPFLEKYKIRVPPERIHDLLSCATLYIGEGATMASEAAILGTPSIYVNTLPLGYIEELESKYKLTSSITNTELALKKALYILNCRGIKQRFVKRRRKLLKEKIDVTKFVVDLIENYN